MPDQEEILEKKKPNLSLQQQNEVYRPKPDLNRSESRIKFQIKPLSGIKKIFVIYSCPHKVSQQKVFSRPVIRIQPF